MRRWHKPISLTKLNASRVPDRPGVFVLLESQDRLNSVLKIIPARSLKRAFYDALEPNEDYRQAMPRAAMFFETFSDAPEADRLLSEYRRRHGRNPVLNSPY
ncbi:MAG: hypothetical protein GYB36_08845 [Alphaproteobacteria bacterium]|nr:hypothetical protein [Alphaproteobacteria bacterium]